MIGPFVIVFLAALDHTVVTTAMPRIVAELGGRGQAWVTTAFMISSVVVTPWYGKLSDRYGRKPLLLVAIAVFLLGSVLCAAAPTVAVLAGFRAVQGAGAGGLMATTSALLADLLTPRRRARYGSYFVAVYAVASMAGPVVGGALTATAGWRWIFLMNVPVGGIAAVIVMRTVQIGHQLRRGRIDFAGAGLLAVALVPLLLVLERGRTWPAGVVAGCGAVGLLGAVAFVAVERRMGAAALVPLRLFRIRTFTLGMAQSVVIGTGGYGVTVLLPWYLHQVRGLAAGTAGALMLPLVFAVVLGSYLCGRVISRTGRCRVPFLAGSALMVAGSVLLLGLGPASGFLHIGLALAVFGVGQGLYQQPISLAVQNAVPRGDLGAATSARSVCWQVGGIAGVTVLVAVFEAVSLDAAFMVLSLVVVLAFALAVVVPDQRLPA